MKDLEKVQKTLSDVFDYLNGNNLQLVGKELLTEVGDAHRIVENLAIHDVVQAKPEKANLEVLAIMGTLVRTLSRIDNLNPELLNETDKKRLLKGKEALTEWCKIDPKDIPRPQ